ncbi:protein-S-isoprenylcysteine O-methyltransferase Ste14 [Paraburkholderia sp. WC7.3g]|uniref:methyltransferase family protein n=1 Tax=Paraburkholderia sp. WC7.3g TaxID=2991070 RepID=UPI003D233802
MQLATEIVVRTLTAVVLSLFVVSTARQYLMDPSRITLIFFALSGVLTVGLAIVSRVPRERDWNPVSLAITLFGTFYYLAIRTEPGIRLVPEFHAVAIQLLGVVIQVYAKCSLRRSFGLLPANRGVIVFGPYRVVRHPMYLGYIVTDAGFLLANFGGWNVLVIFILWTLQIGRIMQEERLLAKDDTYRKYKSRVRYRLVFGLF